jgi:hypothetical protein
VEIQSSCQIDRYRQYISKPACADAKGSADLVIGVTQTEDMLSPVIPTVVFEVGLQNSALQSQSYSFAALKSLDSTPGSIIIDVIVTLTRIRVSAVFPASDCEVGSTLLVYEEYNAENLDRLISMLSFFVYALPVLFDHHRSSITRIPFVSSACMYSLNVLLSDCRLQFC